MENLNHTYFLICYFLPSNQVFFLYFIQSPCVFFRFFIAIHFFLSFACLRNSNNFKIVMTEWEHVTDFLSYPPRKYSRKEFGHVWAACMCHSIVYQNVLVTPENGCQHVLPLTDMGRIMTAMYTTLEKKHAIIIKFRQVRKFHLSALHIFIV